ncbi:MAG: tetratricopeptide repeat protein, partial [bacterium]
MNHAAEKVNPDIPILIAEANFTHLSKLKRNFEELFLRNLNVTGRGYRAVELFPSDPEVLYYKAVVFISAGDFEDAVPYLDKALQLDPGFAEAEALGHKMKAWL